MSPDSIACLAVRFRCYLDSLWPFRCQRPPTTCWLAPTTRRVCHTAPNRRKGQNKPHQGVLAARTKWPAPVIVANVRPPPLLVIPATFPSTIHVLRGWLLYSACFVHSKLSVILSFPIYKIGCLYKHISCEVHDVASIPSCIYSPLHRHIQEHGCRARATPPDSIVPGTRTNRPPCQSPQRPCGTRRRSYRALVGQLPTSPASCCCSRNPQDTYGHRHQHLCT